MPKHGKVFVFVHDENGRCTGAGSLEFVGEDGTASVRPGGVGFAFTIPVTRLTPFPQHPGRHKNL